MDRLTLIATGLLLILLAAAGSAHTLFIKPASFYLTPSQSVTIPLINGTFVRSEGKVKIHRLTGEAIIAPDGTRSVPEESAWRHDGNTTLLDTQFDQPGNYVIGAGTKPLKTHIAADVFNFYLTYEGLSDDAAQRQQLGEENMGAVERYAKFTKAIVQVGERQSDNYAAVLGHPVEIVPLVNPYTLTSGQRLRARILKDGKPLPNEQVFATHEGFYALNDEGRYEEIANLRSDENGIIELDLVAPGRWYIRFIHMNRLGDAEYWYSKLLDRLGVKERRIPYESQWATLTFEVR